ncbi:hypothetical protein [Microbacterium sp.]|uniref:hypothetical protein n=1 Tax=Microbacterium sp. TaxID=51671 RepID=UPI003A8D59E6
MSAQATDESSARDKLRDVLSALSPVAEPTSPEDFLKVVQAARMIDGAARQLLQMSVVTARAAGATWGDVGKTLGVSKQATQKRFSPPKSLPTYDLDPDERLLGPVGLFDEMEELNLAGRYGWHSVGFGIAHHHVVRSLTQWEHRRVAGAKKAAALEADGWDIFGRAFPYTFLKRGTGTPALDEPR